MGGDQQQAAPGNRLIQSGQRSRQEAKAAIGQPGQVIDGQRGRIDNRIADQVNPLGRDAFAG